MSSNGRKISVIKDRDLARKRLPMFAGNGDNLRVQNVLVKELVDNTIDVINEKGTVATSCIIEMSQKRVRVMDNGTGISTDKMEDSDQTHMWAACAKMFAGSNYDGVSDTLGANGVGLTIANYTSQRFNIISFVGKYAKGYMFHDGFLLGTEEAKVSDLEILGDLVENPMLIEEARDMFKPPMEYGFMVDSYLKEAPNELFTEELDVKWFESYIKTRVGEITNPKAGEIIFIIYQDESFEIAENRYTYSKDINSETYVKSWDEKVKEEGCPVIKNGPWQIALSTKDLNIRNVCQGAQIQNKNNANCTIKIQEMDITLSVPVSLKYLSDIYPNYSDQTKVSVKWPYAAISQAFEKCPEIYKHFYIEAEKAYMNSVIKAADSETFWPSLLPPEESEIVIAEGYSAISGLKGMRDARFQACIALRGKILNTWNLDIVGAMKSDIVKQILNAVNSNYKRVIIAVDADRDGDHILCHLISLFARFTNLIQEGRVYFVDTPYYLFKKRGYTMKWGQLKSECPEGYKIHTLKGLGSMTPDQIDTFIMNPETRVLVNVEWDDLAYKSIDKALTDGGEQWIIHDKIKNEEMPKDVEVIDGKINVTGVFNTKYKNWWIFANGNGKNAIEAREGVAQVVRKIIIACYDSGIRENLETKTIDLMGSVVKVHPHGPNSIEDSIKGVATDYKSQVATRLLKGEGNFGFAPGDEGSAGRYTSVIGTPLLTAIYKDLEFVPKTEDGLQEYISCPIPMHIINGSSAIGAGKSCKLDERNAAEVIDWIENLKNNNFSKEIRVPNPISVTGCKTWVDPENGYTYYMATVLKDRDIDDPNKDGKFDIIINLPPNKNAVNVMYNLKQKLPVRATKKIIDLSGKGRPTYIVVPSGYLDEADYRKYGMLDSKIENIFIWDYEKNTMRSSNILDIAENWYKDRCSVVTKRLKQEYQDLEKSIHRINLIKDYAEKRKPDWNRKDVVAIYGEDDATILGNCVERSFYPENLDANDLTRDKQIKEQKEIKENIENIGDFIIFEAREVVRKQEAYDWN